MARVLPARRRTSRRCRAGPAGFEPAFRACCSPIGIRRLYIPFMATRCLTDAPALPTELRAHGRPGGTRTRDLAIKSRCSPSGIRHLDFGHGDERWRISCALPTELPACAERESNPRHHVVLPAFAVLLLWAVATRNGETRSLSYVPAAGFEPASPIRHCGFPGALLVGPSCGM